MRTHKHNLKIAIAIPDMAIGGMEVSVSNLAKEFLKHGHSVDIVVDHGVMHWSKSDLPEGVNIVHLPNSKSLTHYLHIKKLGQYYSSQNYDVLLTNNALNTQASLALFNDIPIRIPIVHNDERWAYRHAMCNHKYWNAAVGVGARVHRKLQRLLPDKADDIVRIFNGILVPPTYTRKQYQKAGKLSIAYVGRLERVKGSHLLPEIMKNVTAQIDCHLTIAGVGLLENEVKAKFAEYGLNDKITFLGRVPNKEVRSLLAKNEVLLFPSLSESFGLSVAEAMANGVVPVATRLPGATDQTVLDGETGFLVNSEDVEGFSSKLIALANDKEMCGNMADKGYGRVKKFFSTEVMIKQYLHLIEQCQQGIHNREHVTNPQVGHELLGCKSYLLPNFMQSTITKLRHIAKGCKK